ncbi:MAG: T9SS type A sorting domain-containing protein, partial [Fibrobacteres bacterium]|nr:T9SS type A sorting domain-containing protein [Fibrobacterota bacterium]
ADNTVKIFYYPNLGTATLPRICDSAKKLVISIPGTIASGCCYPAVADLDKDGKQDLLVGFRNNVLFYSNQGTDDAPVFVNGTTLMLKSLIDSVCLPSTFPGFILSHNMIRKGAKMTYPGVTDWDGDGTLDLIVAFYYFTGAWALSTSELWLFRGVNNSTDCEFSSKKSSNKLSVYPNPFNPTTLISLQSGFKGNGVLKIFNMQGQQVYTCSKPGLKHVWNAKGSAAGVYNVRYTEQGKSRNLRILLTR